jgi:hypothetical protein
MKSMDPSLTYKVLPSRAFAYQSGKSDNDSKSWVVPAEPVFSLFGMHLVADPAPPTDKNVISVLIMVKCIPSRGRTLR